MYSCVNPGREHLQTSKIFTKLLVLIEDRLGEINLINLQPHRKSAVFVTEMHFHIMIV